MENQFETTFGALPPKTDVRDYKVAGAANEKIELPKEYSVDYLPPIKNQGGVSSCVAHATASILEYHDKGQHNLSTNFIYGGQNSICGRDGQGMYLRDACKIVRKYGDALEEDCRGNTEVQACYDLADAALADEEIISRASRFKINSYADANSIDDIKYAIFNYGPVLISVKWYKDYKVDKNGVMYTSETGDYGYHALMAYGWNETGFMIQNTWGKLWGNKGRAILPYQYKVREAKAMVDADNDDIIIPKRNKFLDIIYAILNFFANFFPKR